MTQALCYARVSTALQAERYGLDAQRRLLLERVAERGYEIVPDGDAPIFADDESGSSLDRPAWRRAERAIAAGQVDILVAVDPDRVSRDLADLLAVARSLAQHGVRPEFLTQEFDASPQGRAFFQMRGVFAELERNTIRERTMRGKLEKARQGRVVNPGKLPRWLRMAADGPTVVLDPAWVRVVQLVYHLFVDERLTLRRVAERLTTGGQPTPSGGRQWQITTLHDWLRNPAAVGDLTQWTHRAVEPQRRRKPVAATVQRTLRSSAALRPEAEWCHVPVPPVVDAATWAAAQRRLDQNQAFARRNGRRPYLLRGLVACAACGRRMTGAYRAFRQQRVYQCQHGPRVDGSGACRSRAIPAEPLEGAIWDRIAALIRQPAVLQAELTRRLEHGAPTRDGWEREAEAAQRRLTAIPAEMDRLVDGYGKGLIPDDRMRPQMTRLKTEQEGLRNRIAALQADDDWRERVAREAGDALAFAARAAVGLDALDADGRQALCRLLVREIAVNGDIAVVRTVLPTDGGGGGGGQLCSSRRALVC
ncbi:MAG TPA: recombinase family protein [Candidatus Micrarchaeia archaeon]|nr:recombinase family protein [Candidatus Micrarchaeia archaeon]